MKLEELLVGAEPLGNYAIVEVEEAATKQGSIYIPQSAVAPPKRGTVLKAGCGQKNGLNGELIPMIVQPGDRILFHPSGLQTYEIDGVPVSVIHEGDIIMRWAEAKV